MLHVIRGTMTILDPVPEKYALCTLDLTGTHASGADMNLLAAAGSFHSNSLNVRVPDFIRSSM